MNDRYKLFQGDCLDELKKLDDNSIDSIVTDPPYGLAFMGKKWDYDVPSQAIWEECMRVLKPGGHLLAFAGSRTYHRMAVRIEDAGFEIRDQIMWVYGSGFPKSHNIGKAVDKLEGKEVFIGKGFNVAGQGIGLNQNKELRSDHPNYVKPTYDNEWEGWGTALKPAHEPIVMARKSFKGSVAENVLEWGTGGINIDGCRIKPKEGDNYNTLENVVVEGKDAGIYTNYDQRGENSKATNKTGYREKRIVKNDEGRFPANIIFDEEAGKILDEQSGNVKGMASQNCNNQKLYGGNALNASSTTRSGFKEGYNDNGGASRFFYCPKANKSDRNEGSDNNHPTVKPTNLMTYLVRLVTPKDGVVLDPFMGSGSTGKACMREDFQFVGIEREEEYIEIAKQRIEWEYKKKHPHNWF